MFRLLAVILSILLVATASFGQNSDEIRSINKEIRHNELLISYEQQTLGDLKEIYGNAHMLELSQLISGGAGVTAAAWFVSLVTPLVALGIFGVGVDAADFVLPAAVVAFPISGAGAYYAGKSFDIEMANPEFLKRLRDSKFFDDGEMPIVTEYSQVSMRGNNADPVPRMQDKIRLHQLIAKKVLEQSQALLSGPSANLDGTYILRPLRTVNYLKLSIARTEYNIRQLQTLNGLLQNLKMAYEAK